VLVVLGALAGCSPSSPAARTALAVAAAASLRPAVAALTEAYEAEHDVTLTVSADSSAALRTQVEEGARFDVFLAADTRNPQALADAGLADEPVRFAANAVALVVPAANPGLIRDPADLARPGLRLIAAGEEVPITRYADEVLRNLAATQPDPAGFEAAVRANIASREENVAAVVARIALGEGDAAFVYATDAQATEDLSVIAISDEMNVRAVYAGVVPRAATQPAEGGAFLAWVAGAEGRAVLAPFGFMAP